MTPAERPPQPSPDAAPPDTATGLPRIGSWRTVYAIVLGIFLVWVALLTWLTQSYQ
jgi:hypothetical protein